MIRTEAEQLRRHAQALALWARRLADRLAREEDDYLARCSVADEREAEGRAASEGR